MTDQHWEEISPEEAYFEAALQLAQLRLIEQEIPPEEECERNEALDERMIRLIRDQTRRNQSFVNRKRIAKRIGLSLLVILLLLNIALTTSFATNAAFREQIFRLFVDTFPTHSHVESAAGEEETLSGKSTVPVSEYSLTWLPDEGIIRTESYRSMTMSSAAYRSETGVSINLDACLETVGSSVNTEGMEPRVVTIGKDDLQVFHAGDKLILIWQNGEIHFIMETHGLTEAEAILTALSVSAVDE